MLLRCVIIVLCIQSSWTNNLTLNDGVIIPLFGLGLWDCKPGGEAEEVVDFALRNNYRLLDTATTYGNEEDVGRAVRKSDVKREDIFVVTKLHDTDHGYEETKTAFHLSLNKLGVDYVDLYLIHSPGGGKLVETYQAMLEMKQQGLIRSVGVSNFGVHHLEGLRNSGKPLPSVNQIELHPWQRNEAIVKYCHDNNIAVMGYSPLRQGDALNHPTVIKLSGKYNKTPAQILIRWSVQHGFITIPKSSKQKRILQNMEVFDWEISIEDIITMNTFPQSCDYDPTEFPWEG